MDRRELAPETHSEFRAAILALFAEAADTAGVRREDFIRRLGTTFESHCVPLPSAPPLAETVTETVARYGEAFDSRDWRQNAELLHHQALRYLAGLARWRQLIANPTAQHLVPYLRFVTFKITVFGRPTTSWRA